MGKQEIIKLMQEIVGKKTQVFHIATIKEVTGNTCTIAPLDEDMPQEIDGVRLKAFSDGEYGILITPKKDSFVIAMQLNDVDYAVTHYDEIDSISISINDKNSVTILDKKISLKVDKTTAIITDSKIEINADEIVFNGGEHKGLVKVEAMKTKLNNLEKQVNKIVQQLQSISVALAPSGSFPLAPFFSSITPLVETQKSDIENDKITH